MSRSETFSDPTLTSESPPPPKLPPDRTPWMSASANDAMMATRNSAMMAVPTVDFDSRRNEASMQVLLETGLGNAALGAAFPAIKARLPLARCPTLGPPPHQQGFQMARRKYVVGNWKMHGLAADLAEVRAIADGAERLSGRGCRSLPAGDPHRTGSARRAGFPHRRAGRSFRGEGRPYGLHLRRHARDAGRKADHRRPFRAPRGPAREQRGGSRQGGGRPCRRACR